MTFHFVMYFIKDVTRGILGQNATRYAGIVKAQLIVTM